MVTTMNEEEKMAQSVFVAMILSWFVPLLGLVVQPYVLVKAKPLRTNAAVSAIYQGRAKKAYVGALVYCALSGLVLLLFAAMVAYSAAMSK
jgi:RsiW-degrading membrane proteinase PrsW (M82 family)